MILMKQLKSFKYNELLSDQLQQKKCVFETRGFISTQSKKI